MRCNVLVVDDGFDGPELRGDLYKTFFERCGPELGIEIVPTILERPNELQSVLRARRFDAAIVDAVLNEREGWRTFSSGEAIETIGPSVPVAIISGQWDESNSAQISDVIKRPNCRTFMHWRDIDANQPGGQIDYAIRSFGRMLFEGKKLDPSLNLGPDEPLWILHISDVQTGGFGSADELRLETRRCAERVRRETGSSGPTFIAFTGDVAEFGDPGQYASARNWIAYFVEQLNWHSLPSRRILYVPGNHDVNVSLSSSARLRYVGTPTDPKDERMQLVREVLHPSLVSYGLAPYRRFHDSVALRDSFIDFKADWPTSWVEEGFLHLGVAFYGVNTALPVSAHGLPDRFVEADTLAAVSERLERIHSDMQDDRPLVIGLGHHTPVEASGDGGVQNPRAFAKLFGGAVPTSLFLHGHTHAHKVVTSDDPVQMVRSCATTLTKLSSARPEDSLRGFNLLKLSRSGGAVDGLTAICYNWIDSDIQPTMTKSWKIGKAGHFQPIG